jgi:hypothetical protein
MLNNELEAKALYRKLLSMPSTPFGNPIYSREDFSLGLRGLKSRGSI